MELPPKVTSKLATVPSTEGQFPNLPLGSFKVAQTPRNAALAGCVVPQFSPVFFFFLGGVVFL